MIFTYEIELASTTLRTRRSSISSHRRSTIPICGINWLSCLFSYYHHIIWATKYCGPNEQPAREVGERGSERSRRSSRSHHMWGARLGRGREDERLRQPTDLAHLEHLARSSVILMEKHSSPSPHNFHKAMDLLRQQYNMNFVMLCGRCNGPHDYDEITAPER